MAYETIGFEVTDGVATITLNRPRAYNAMNLTLGRELLAAVLEADDDPAVRCVAIIGAGTAFCAGGDVKEFAAAGSRAAHYILELTTYLHGAVSRLNRAAKPVVIGVNGVAAGGGMGLALAGDVVVAASSARFSLAYRGIAASPDVSTTYILPRLVGVRRATELHFLNRTLSAAEALEWGLVTRVHSDAEFGGAFAALARELAAGPTVAFARAKRLFHDSTAETLETQMELEAQAIAACARTEDFAQAVEAFVAKRTPTFHGR